MQKLAAILLVTFIVLLILYPPTAGKETFQQDTHQSGTAPVAEIRLSEAVNTIGKIPLPPGFERIHLEKKSFGEWLRKSALKKKNIVKLYNGHPKANQSQHFAVLDISTGNRDLQQCADALMRLKAEYLFSIADYKHINFVAGDKTVFNFVEYALGKRFALRGQRLAGFQTYTDISCFTHACLMDFMNLVFSYCSTYTLHSQTKPVANFSDMEPGDMLVKAGSPGHAMMVGDVAINPQTKEKIYLLIQSFMPAQDMHIVINPLQKKMGPWFSVSQNGSIITPGYVFEKNQLRRW